MRRLLSRPSVWVGSLSVVVVVGFLLMNRWGSEESIHLDISRARANERPSPVLASEQPATSEIVGRSGRNHGGGSGVYSDRRVTDMIRRATSPGRGNPVASGRAH